MIAELTRWPATVALLAAWRRDDAAACLDVAGLVRAVSQGYTDYALGWTVAIGACFPVRRCAELLVIQALRAGA